MHWVWNRSRTKGNVRLVMLAVADKAPGADCATHIGMTELIQRLNASRSTVQVALDKALASGELCELEPARGSRPARYQLPLAVGHSQTKDDARGPNPGPVATGQGTETGPYPRPGARRSGR